VGQRLALFWGLQRLGLSALWALAVASAFGVVFSVLARTWWRRAIIGLGFPLSLALSGVATLPAWAWLLPLALLLLIYPLNAWRDAPCFQHRRTPCMTWRHLPRCQQVRCCWMPAAVWATGSKPCARPIPQPSCMGWNGVGRCGA